MNCEKCGRPLIADEKKLCPHCRNKFNRKAKIATAISLGAAILGGAIIGWLGFGGKNKNK